MNIGIIGCGYIGKKRAESIKEPHQLVAVCDINEDNARKLCNGKPDIFVTTDYKELIDKAKVDIVVIATLNYMLAPITLYAVQRGKHVIVEKPAGIAPSQIVPILEAMKKTKSKVKVGFNHRYHKAFLKAKEIIDTLDVGSIMFIRGRYGHGGRIGYNKEWRANPELSGGGELIDQGVHLIDLSRWFMGDFTKVDGFAENYYWDMPVDDNGFISLRKEDGRAAWLQVSCTEWKNMFCFEIYCKKAKLIIDGLGGSYGIETLKYYQMLPEMGPPETIIYEYPFADHSWEYEIEELIQAVTTDTPLKMGDISDAYEALKIVEKIYKNSN